MPNLGDYIGQLMSEMTIARMHADLEALKVAELYSSHPILKNFAIPRFRLPNIELDIPVVITHMEEFNEELAKGTATVEDMQNAFKILLKNELKTERSRLKAEQFNKLEREIDKKISSLKLPKVISVDVNRIADELAETTSIYFSKEGWPFKEEKAKEFEKRLKELARLEFLRISKPSSRLEVLVKTSEIREAGPNETITRINLKINEDAFEWTTVESNGKEKDFLVSE